MIYADFKGLGAQPKGCTFNPRIVFTLKKQTKQTK